VRDGCRSVTLFDDTGDQNGLLAAAAASGTVIATDRSKEAELATLLPAGEPHSLSFTFFDSFL
jgi:hypothetical protein